MECHESTSDLVLSVVRAVSRLFSVYEVVNNFECGFHAKKSVILVRRSKPVTAKIDLEGNLPRFTKFLGLVASFQDYAAEGNL